MKKFLSISFGALAAIVLTVSCNQKVDPQTPSNDPGTPSAEKITITATLSDALTKVTFEPTYDSNSKPTEMAHKWQTGDKLRITNASSVSEEFELVSGEDTDTGVFSGNSIDGGPFTVEAVPVSNPGSTNATQTQAADGSTAHLLFVASATGVTDLSNIVLAETSNIIGFVAKLPAGVAATINELEIEKSIDDFANSDKLNVTITNPEDVDNDDILKVYANIPASWNIVANTKMFLRFKSTNTAHTVYTRYQEFTSAVTPQAGKFNYIKMNCSNIDKYAGGDGTDAAKAYLIGDPYQLAAVNGLATGGQTTYFKMIDDVDMNGVTHNPINTNSGYTQSVDLDGNNKTISNLGVSLFYVLKGSVSNLFFDKPTINSGSQRGVLAQYVQGTGHTVTNVDVSNGVVEGGTNSGGLIGRINSGTAGVTSITITDCDVTNTSVKAACAGGLLGSAEAKVVVSNCTYSGNTVTGTTQKIGGLVGVTNDNTACSFTGCRVEEATVDASGITGDARAGGFIGQLGEGSYVYGCSVGTSSSKVIVKSGQYDSTNSKAMNTGGFVGVNYGIITKDSSDNHCKAYVTITSKNTVGSQINLGGFVGFQRGTISYSDAVVAMGTNDIQGQYIGGFAGYIVFQNGKTVVTDHCTVCGDGDSSTVDIRGNNYSGGFVGGVESGDAIISNCHVLDGTVFIGQSSAGGFAGIIKTGTIENCSANVDFQCRGGNAGGFAGAITGGTVQNCSSAGQLSQISGTNSVFGGFAGYVNGVDLRKCSSTVNITVARNYVGGLVGDFQTANTVSECFYNGTISGPANTKGGLIGTTQAVAAVITNCYTAGELVGSSGTQIYGGIVGELKAGGSVTNCYSTMDMTHGGRAMGGIVGRACSGGWPVSNESSNTISKCIAWNPAITYDGTASTSASSGAIIGYTSFKNTLNNCYRRSDMAYNNSNTAVGTTCQTSMVDQIDCDGTNWAINGNRPAGGTPAGTSADAQYQAPYYGVAAASTATVSSLAQTLGWDSSVWDFTGDLPTLK